MEKLKLKGTDLLGIGKLEMGLLTIKSFVICLYIMLIYWLSLHFESLHMLFFPTLGAFSFLFISRNFDRKELSNIALGACISSILGTLLFHLSPGVLSIFCNTLITIWLIKKFKWNAPPILAISFIPFFAQSPNLWMIPISVSGSMLGLVLSLFIAQTLEQKDILTFPLFMQRWKIGTKSE